MQEKVKIPEITFEVESRGSFERTEKIVQKILDLAGIVPAEDGGSIYLYPVENASTKIRVEMHDLETTVEIE